MILGLHGKRHAGGRSLRVVDEHVDAAEGIVDLLHRVLDDLFGFLIRVDIRHDGQHLDAVETLQLLLGVEQLLLVAAGDGQVRAFLGISRRHAVADRFCLAAAGDDGDLARENTHVFIAPFQGIYIFLLNYTHFLAKGQFLHTKKRAANSFFGICGAR